MGSPITWHNVQGASLSDAGRSMEAAQRSFGGAFDGLQDILKQRQVREEKLWQEGKVSNTNAFRAALMQPNSPEAFNDPTQIATRQQMIAGFGDQFDPSVLTEQDNRVNLLNQRGEAAIKYQNSMLDAKEAPIMEAARVAYQTGNKAEGDRLSQGLRRGSETVQFGLDSAEKVAERSRAAADQIMQKEMQTSNIDRNTNANTNANATLKIHQDEAAAKVEAALVARIDKNRQELLSANDKNASSEGGTEAIFKALRENIKDPDNLANAQQAASEIIAQPGMTTATAINSLLGMKRNSWFNTDSGERADALKAANAAAATPDAINQALMRAQATTSLIEEQTALKARRGGNNTTTRTTTTEYGAPNTEGITNASLANNPPSKGVDPSAVRQVKGAPKPMVFDAKTGLSPEAALVQALPSATTTPKQIEAFNKTVRAASEKQDAKPSYKKWIAAKDKLEELKDTAAKMSPGRREDYLAMRLPALEAEAKFQSNYLPTY